MRAQLSLELMLYVTLAGLALLFALSTIAKVSARINSGLQTFEVSQFVNDINNALTSNDSALVDVFLPRGLCNSTASGSALETPYGTLYLASRLYVAANTFCPDDVYASFKISYNSSDAYLLRSG